MHRDISAKNLLVESLSPAEAALCDYGKAIMAEESTDTAIGPKPTLAPEVWCQRPYNNKIDVWSLAYAWLGTFRLGLLARPEKIDKATHRQILEVVHLLLETGDIEEHFSILLRQMLAWEPQDRISTDEALNHPCWKDVLDPRQDEDQACAQQETQESNTSSIRKRKSHPTQMGTERSSLPPNVPPNCPPLGPTCTGNPTLLTVWKTHHVSSEETQLDSQENRGADWLKFHTERSRRQSGRQTNTLLLRY